MMTNIVYIKYTSKYKEATLKLLAFLWTHLDDQNRRQLFAWRYEQNPSATRNFMYLAISGTNVVGFRAFVPQMLLCNGKQITGLTAADAVVHPDYRRQGIFSGLIRLFLNDIGDHPADNVVIYNLSSNEYSTPGYLKLGWQATSGLKRFALRYDPLQDIRLRLTRQKSNEVRFGMYHFNDITLEVCNKVYPTEMAELIDRKSKKPAITCIRESGYFSWRYAFRDKTYVFVYLRVKGQLEAYLVINKVSDSQFLLWEYAAKSNKILRKTIKMAVRKIGMPFLRSWVLSEHDSARLRQCGFIAAPAKIWNLLGKKRLPVLVRPASLTVSENYFVVNGVDVRDIENWQFFIADRH